ncbi:MAG: hypothetical protein ACOYNS_18455, partial [Bacteroidota bacterium]
MRTAFLLFVVFTTAAFSTIRIVDGTGAGLATNRFAKLSEAVTAASAGDTVLFLPGVYKEGESVSIDKKLIILGSGYRNVENGGTHLYTSLALGPNADNSKISGIRFVGYGISKNATDYVTVSNNLFMSSGTISSDGAVGDTIRNNIFLGGWISYTYNVGIINCVIANNIFRGPGGATYAITVNSVSSISNLQVLNNIVTSYSTLIYNAWE